MISTYLPLLHEKSGTILLVLVGLMADWQACRQSDKVLVYLNFFKILGIDTEKDGVQLLHPYITYLTIYVTMYFNQKTD